MKPFRKASQVLWRSVPRFLCTRPFRSHLRAISSGLMTVPSGRRCSCCFHSHEGRARICWITSMGSKALLYRCTNPVTDRGAMNFLSMV